MSYCSKCGGLKDGNYCPICVDWEFEKKEEEKKVKQVVKIKEQYSPRMRLANSRRLAQERMDDLHYWKKLWEEEKYESLLLEEKKPKITEITEVEIAWEWVCVAKPITKKALPLFEIKCNGYGDKEQANCVVTVFTEKAVELAKESIQSLYSHLSDKKFKEPSMIHDWREVVADTPIED